MWHHATGKAGHPGKGLAHRRRWPVAMAVLAATGSMVTVAASSGASAAAGTRAGTAATRVFAQTNLIANSATYGPKLVDSHLTNAWGMAAAPGSPLWVSDNNSGFATVYSGGINGGSVSLDLTVPVPGGNATGQVFNPDSNAFHVGGPTGGAAAFIVDSDSIGATQSPGQIEAWNGGSSFVVETSPTGGPGGKTPAGAVFKGLALATNTSSGPELFAADVANARVDVFNSAFQFTAVPWEFRDPQIPAGFAPFNVQLLGGKLYVTYGKQNKTHTNVIPGPGYVDVFTVNGQLLKHLISQGPLNEPWGLAIAPAGFGAFAGDLLVGNLGNGWINAFNPTTGKYLGALLSTTGYPIAINGLWGLMVGNSAFGGSSSLVFTAGPNSYNDGLVGVLNPKP